MPDTDKRTIVSILNTFQLHYQAFGLPFLSFAQLFDILAPTEQSLIARLNGVTASTLLDEKGALTESQSYINPENRLLGVRVQKEAFQAFSSMASKLKSETGQTLIIASGFRSPAYQMMIFLRTLYDNEFDLKQATRFCKLPKESEHCNAPYHAIDLALSDQPDIEDFGATDAYAWMYEHAFECGFTLSYTQNNSRGMAFEPWHWLYCPNK